jgi:hypothetical protein
MKTFLALTGVLALGACGGSMGDSMGVSSSEVAAMDQAATGVSAAAVTYRTGMASITTAADCAAAVEEYSSQVQPDVDRIAQMSGRMDGAMGSMGQMMGADMECGAEVMQQELHRHLGVACTAEDMAANQAEAALHAEAMQGFAEHMRMRSDEMGTMMEANGGMMGGNGGMMGGGAGTGMMDGSWTTPDGSTIPYEHTMPGCTYHDGEYQADGDATNSGTTDGGTGVESAQ